MADTIDHADAQVRAKFILNIQPPSHTDPDDNLARAYLDLRRRLDEALAYPTDKENQAPPGNLSNILCAFVSSRKSRLAIKEG